MSSSERRLASRALLGPADCGRSAPDGRSSGADMLTDATGGGGAGQRSGPLPLPPCGEPAKLPVEFRSEPSCGPSPRGFMLEGRPTPELDMRSSPEALGRVPGEEGPRLSVCASVSGGRGLSGGVPASGPLWADGMCRGDTN